MSVIFFPPASLPGISVMSTWEDEMLCASPSSSNENKRQNIFPGIFQTFFFNVLLNMAFIIFINFLVFKCLSQDFDESQSLSRQMALV